MSSESFNFYPPTVGRMTASEPNVQNLPRAVVLDQPKAPCLIPPDGWSCSRGEGHTGPCAASRTHYDEGPLQPDDAARIDAAWARHLAAAEADAYAELRKLSEKWRTRAIIDGALKNLQERPAGRFGGRK